MIVKNEEANLPGCFASIADLVDEIVIVDTGSTDLTKVIAAGIGARVFEFFPCRHCGAAYLRAYTDRTESLDYLWAEPGGQFLADLSIGSRLGDWSRPRARVDAEARRRARGLACLAHRARNRLNRLGVSVERGGSLLRGDGPLRGRV